MKRILILLLIMTVLFYTIGVSEASPILVGEWWNAPIDIIRDARDRLNRAIVDKGGEAVFTAPVTQESYQGSIPLNSILHSRLVSLRLS